MRFIIRLKCIQREKQKNNNLIEKKLILSNQTLIEIDLQQLANTKSLQHQKFQTKELMGYHLVQTIFINLPITVAIQRLWQLILTADILEAFNHYFRTSNIKSKKSNFFLRQISLRIPLEVNQKQVYQQTEPVIKVNQEVIMNQKEHKITYRNVDLNQGLSVLNGQFFHQFEQNNKGETYLIFGSSAKNGNNRIPQKSQVQIQLIKLKDLLQNGFQKDFQRKTSHFGKFC